MASSTATSTAIRSAVIGYGLAGRVFHCPFIAAVPGLDLATIVQRHGDEAAEAYPAVTIARDIEEVLQDKSIELVVVGTPNTTHFELAQRVVSAGKHCVIDKPFAATSEEAATLVKLSQETGKHIVPFHNRRFDGDYLTVKKLLADGTLGRVVEISSRFDRFRPMVREGSWKEEAGPMSGILFDLGSHLIDQALALFGAPEAITAQVYEDRDGSTIDDAFELTLEYEQGRMRYRCGSTLLAADAEPRFRMNGTSGSFVKYGVDPQEATVGAGTRPPVASSDATWLAEPESEWGKLSVAVSDGLRPDVEQKPHPTIAGDYRMFYENVRDAINGTAELAIRPEDGYRCIRMLEYALQSSKEQRSVRVNL